MLAGSGKRLGVYINFSCSATQGPLRFSSGTKTGIESVDSISLESKHTEFEFTYSGGT